MADVFQSGAASIRVDSRHATTSGVDAARFAGFGGLSSRNRNWNLQADGAIFETSSVWRVSTSPGTATKTRGTDADILIVGIVTQGIVDIQVSSGASMRFLAGESFHIMSAAACELTWPVPTRFVLIVASTAVLEEYGAVIHGECNRIDADTDLLRPIASFSETLVAHHALDMNLTKFLLERLLQEQLGAILLSNESYAAPELSPDTRSTGSRRRSSRPSTLTTDSLQQRSHMTRASHSASCRRSLPTTVRASRARSVTHAHATRRACCTTADTRPSPKTRSPATPGSRPHTSCAEPSKTYPRKPDFHANTSIDGRFAHTTGRVAHVTKCR